MQSHIEQHDKDTETVSLEEFCKKEWLEELLISQYELTLEELVKLNMIPKVQDAIIFLGC